MLKAGITIGCLVALAAGVTLVYRLRHTRRAPSPLTGHEPFAEALAVTVGRAGGMLVGAYLAGLLTLGAGLRLLMRVLAATSGDDVQGAVTDAGEVIGEVSVGGTLFLVAVVGIGSSVLGLAAYTILRRWLPDSSLAAGLVCVAVGAGLLVRPTAMLNAESIDFALVTPPTLAVALCLVTLLLFGATFGVLVDHLAPRWPPPSPTAKGLASVLPFALLLPSPPVFLLAVVGIVAGTTLTRAHRRRRIVEGSSRRDVPGPAGRIALLVAGGIGAFSVAAAAGQVLTS